MTYEQDAVECRTLPWAGARGCSCVQYEALYFWIKTVVSSSSELRPSDRTVEERLGSWKEIAAFLGRDVRTVQRWEKAEGLPVHRHRHSKLDTVYAYKGELLGWQDSRRRSNFSRGEAEAAVFSESPAGPLEALSPGTRHASPRAGYLWPAIGLGGILASAVIALFLSKTLSHEPGMRTAEAAVPLVSFLGKNLAQPSRPMGGGWRLYRMESGKIISIST